MYVCEHIPTYFYAYTHVFTLIQIPTCRCVYIHAHINTYTRVIMCTQTNTSKENILFPCTGIFDAFCIIVTATLMIVDICW